MKTHLRQFARRAALTAALSGLAIGGTVAIAAPAQAASLKVVTVQCIEDTSEPIGDDSPYFMVFAASPTNPSATAFGKWGPGYLDNNVSTGESFSPNASIIASVPSNWI